MIWTSIFVNSIWCSRWICRKLHNKFLNEKHHGPNTAWMNDVPNQSKWASELFSGILQWQSLVPILPTQRWIQYLRPHYSAPPTLTFSVFLQCVYASLAIDSIGWPGMTSGVTTKVSPPHQHKRGQPPAQFPLYSHLQGPFFISILLGLCTITFYELFCSSISSISLTEVWQSMAVFNFWHLLQGSTLQSTKTLLLSTTLWHLFKYCKILKIAINLVISSF